MKRKWQCVFDKKIIEEFLNRYDLWYLDNEGFSLEIEKYRESKKLLKKFLEKFSLEKLKKMSLQEYAIGGKRQDTFCWWVEVKLENLGGISGGKLTAYQRYGISFSNEENKYIFKHANWAQSKYGNDVNAVYEKVRNSIISLYEAIKKNDYVEIEKNILNPLFKNKLTFLYDSKNWIPIYSDDDLNVILKILKIQSEKKDRVYKRKILFEFYKALQRDDISPTQFMLFIYSDFGYKRILRGKESKKVKKAICLNDYKITVGNFNAADYEIAMDNIDWHGMVERSQATEEMKKIVGRKGEEIVKIYLEKSREKLKIRGEIHSACENDDGQHYDFSYENENGERFYIEVKATKQNNIGQIRLEMSHYEYEVMLENIDNYIIYYVNDALNTEGNIKIIPIPAKEIQKMLFPVKYRLAIKKTN